MTFSSGRTLAEVATETRGAVGVSGDAQVRVKGVKQDSRAVVSGDLFVVRRGGTHDGAQYVQDALSRGAVALIVSSSDGQVFPVPCIRVDNIDKALAFASACVYGHPSFSMEVVGITGTNGKTTTSHLLRHAIDAATGRPACGLVGTTGHLYKDLALPSVHTTPEADELARILSEMRQRGAAYVSMEVSSIALSRERVAAVRFRVAAFTNLTQDHLDFHGSMKAYGAAKEKLFTECDPGAVCINVGDPFGLALTKKVRAPLITVSSTPNDAADIRPVTFSEDMRGMRGTLATPNGILPFEWKLLGKHNLENALVALGTVSHLGLPIEKAVLGIGTLRGVAGRLERCESEEDDIQVIVDYAHTPDALARVLDTLREGLRGRLVCVFGCGGDRDKTKRPLMAAAVGARAHHSIVTNDNPRSEDPSVIASEIVRGFGTGASFAIELDRKKAIRSAVLAASPGDTVLVAGKGHEDYQIVGNQKSHFDDREVAKEALTERRGRS